MTDLSNILKNAVSGAVNEAQRIKEIKEEFTSSIVVNLYSAIPDFKKLGVAEINILLHPKGAVISFGPQSALEKIEMKLDEVVSARLGWTESDCSSLCSDLDRVSGNNFKFSSRVVEVYPVPPGPQHCNWGW